MAKPVTPEIHVYADAEAMSRAAAEWLADCAQQALSGGGWFSLALAGGNTPRRLYEILASDFGGTVPWQRVMFFWSDERYVPQGDEHSNYRMVEESLLKHLGVPVGNVHPLPTHRKNPEDAADEYEAFLRSQTESKWPRFDVVLLGMGSDGHTASLFPGSPALDEKRRWVVSTEAPVEPHRRLTMTLPVINAAANVCFVAAGQEKAKALEAAFAARPDKTRCPASAVRPTNGRLICWADESAAAELRAAKTVTIHRHTG